MLLFTDCIIILCNYNVTNIGRVNTARCNNEGYDAMAQRVLQEFVAFLFKYVEMVCLALKTLVTVERLSSQ